VMFSFMKSIKYWSILVQFLVFLCLLLLLKSFNFQHLLLIISAFFSGIIAYRSKSIYYSLATTILFLFLCDVFLIKFVIQ